MAAQPIYLGPFARIVGVHWRTGSYLQLNVRLARSTATGGGNSCGGGPPVPVGDYVGVYTSELQFRNWMENVGFPADDYFNLLAFENGSWGAPTGSVTVTGMPDLKKLATTFGGDGHFGYSYMEIAAFNTTLADPTDPYALWNIPAGGAADVPAPGGGAYTLGLPSVDIMARAISGLSCYDWGGAAGFTEGGQAAAYAVYANWSPYGGARIAYHDETYEPVACKLSGPGEIRGDATGENPTPSIVSILFKKVAAP